ncbi:helix-turn-helix domain-containing protein [Flavobacterium sp. ALJ2]|uniref:helix-turn-helix domain-containing protein n=1 Tax=Flavobacterium sp. ALJ2 TaxID=2786960 RepID=UPI00210784C5
MFGKNLKKIRSVYSMSQQDFAAIFDLKRGTLGAYEEGRSNPKLETVIKIANHFSIGIEELLIKELTVNRLLKFNELLTVESDAFNIVDFDGIHCVLPNDKHYFIKGFSFGINLEKFPVIKIPNVDNTNRMAFSVDDLSMTGGSMEFFPKDIVIGAECDKFAIDDKTFVIALTQNELLFRKFFKVDDHFVLKADHHGVVDLALSAKDVICIWKIEHVIQYGMNSREIFLENRLATIEQTIASLKNNK